MRPLSNKNILLWVFLILFFVLRLVLSLHTEHYLVDSQINQFIAELAHVGIPAERIPLSHAVPMAFILPLFVLTFIYKNSVDFLLHLGNGISVTYYCATIVALYFLARRFFSKNAAIVTCVVFCLNGYAFALSGVGEPYAGYVFYLTCFFLVLIDYIDKYSFAKALLLGVLTAFCVLSRKEGILVYPVMFISLAFAGKRGSAMNVLKRSVVPVFLSILILTPWFIYLYSKTGVILNRQVTDIIMMKGATGGLQYMVEREFLTAHGPHAWYYRFWNLLVYLFYYLLNNLKGWNLLGVFLAVGVFFTIRKKRYLPFYSYIVLFTLAGLFTQYQVEADQLKDVAVQFISYDITRYQMAWLPAESMMIVAGFVGLLKIFDARFRKKALSTLLFIIIIVSITWGAVGVIGLQYELISRGSYENTRNPLRSFASLSVGQIPLLRVAAKFRQMNVVNKNVAVVSRYNTSANLIALEAFGGPQQYYSCSAGDWQWVGDRSQYVDGGIAMASTLYADPIPKAIDGGPYGCHKLVEGATLDELNIDYLIMDGTLLPSFPRVLIAKGKWNLIYKEGAVELYELPKSQDEWAGSYDTIALPKSNNPIMETHALGINSPLVWNKGQIVVSGRTISYVDSGDDVIWKRVFGGLLYPVKGSRNLFTTYNGEGVYIAGLMGDEPVLRRISSDVPSEVVASDIKGSLQISTYVNGIVIFRNCTRNEEIHSLNLGDVAISVRILNSRKVWFLTSGGKSLVFSLESGKIIEEYKWAKHPSTNLLLTQDNGITFCHDERLYKLSLPRGDEIISHPFEDRCYAFSGDDTGERLFLSASSGIYEVSTSAIKLIEEGSDVFRVSYDDASGILAGASLSGAFKAWDGSGKLIHESALGDSVIAAPTAVDDSWYIITERGRYHRVYKN